MRKISKLVIFLSMLQGVVYGQVNSNSYSLSGEIEGMPDKTPVYLVRLSNGDTVTKVISEGGKFSLSGKLADNGEMHFLTFDSTGLGLPKTKQTWIRLYFDNSPIFISGEFANWPNITIKGSPSILVYDMLAEQLIAIRKKELERKSAPNLDSISIELIEREFNSKLLKLFLSYPDEFAVAELNKRNPSFDFDEFSTLYNALTPRVKDSYPGRMLRRKLEWKKPENLIKLNNIIPDFNFIDTLGVERSIRNEYEKSRYTLIDFWASWCGPCVDEIPNLRSSFVKYKRNELNIIGISMDRRESDWKEALRKNSPEWDQGIDLNGEVVKSIFGIGSIPAYLLIDRDGRMIAFFCAAGEYQSFGPHIRNEGLNETLSKLISQLN